MATYCTVRGPSRFQADPVKGSRFIATVAPAEDEATALAVVGEVAARWPDASHHCWAFRLRSGRARSSDEGEPGGSAGRPILAQIEGHGLSDVVVVVSRWFGGTKLGVGGLIRAYGGTAGMALDRAEVVEVPDTAAVRLTYAYSDTQAVQAVCAAEGLELREPEYGAEVRAFLDIPVADLTRITEALKDRSAGRVVVEPVQAPGDPQSSFS